ncbi:DUF1801 domain-containing protein [Ruminococcaceae bacterium OttesenSCG-928-L11]|nr:DUF1801 domain-containing protein [Ruminococcaceae bacterium OttesenSCG-928-L11]
MEAYITGCDPQKQDILRKIRQVIQAAAPDAEERTSWGMPTYWQGENLVHFSDAKHHVGFHPSPDAIDAFAEQLSSYQTSKGTIRFPYDAPIPYDLIDSITRWRVEQVQAKRGG